jgi:hypothetical protein
VNHESRRSEYPRASPTTNKSSFNLKLSTCQSDNSSRGCGSWHSSLVKPHGHVTFTGIVQPRDGTVVTVQYCHGQQRLRHSGLERSGLRPFRNSTAGSELESTHRVPVVIYSVVVRNTDRIRLYDTFDCLYNRHNGISQALLWVCRLLGILCTAKCSASGNVLLVPSSGSNVASDMGDGQ